MLASDLDDDFEFDTDFEDDIPDWQSPTLSGDELAWAAPDLTPLQEPKLSANEANHITKTLARPRRPPCG